QFEFGITTVRHPLPALAGGATTADVIQAAVATVQARGVESSAGHAAAPPQMAADSGAEQASCAGHAEQAAAGLLQGREVGNAAQTHGLTQIPPLLQQCREAAIVGLEEGLEDQAGEELRLGVQLGADLV